MTAEIAILNRSGIALAADSAVTIGRERVWKYSNKLFSLGPHNDIGIMIYGAGDFVGFHWESVIKSFRENVKNLRFQKVEDCSDAFSTFLLNERFTDEISESMSAHSVFIKAIENLKNEREYDSVIEFRTQTLATIKNKSKELRQNHICIENLQKDLFEELFKENITKLSFDIFQKHLTKPIINALLDYVYNFFIRSNCNSGFETGIVFAGYGDLEYFPVVIHNIVDGKYHQFLRTWNEQVTDLNTDRKSRAFIIPFAQIDMTHLFMEGTGVAQIIFIRELLKEVLNAKSEELIRNYVIDKNEQSVETHIQARDNLKLVEMFLKKFRDYRQDSVVKPMMKVVSALPREEMADMAEALVELTSLRRKIDSKLESVGGPIDVAIISKGDGFIWIKRKNYFDSSLNMDYAKRTSLRVYGGDHDESC